MKISVGDMLHNPAYDSDGHTVEGTYYLILDTRKKFRYIALCISDGTITGLDKYHARKYCEKVTYDAAKHRGNLDI